MDVRRRVDLLVQATVARWPRRPPLALLCRLRWLLPLLVMVGLAWPLPEGGAGWQVARTVGREWVACATTGEPPVPAWRHALREGIDEDGLDPDWIAARLADDVPPEARLVSPRQAAHPDYEIERVAADRPAAHPRTVVVAVIDSGVAADHPDVDVVRPGIDLVAPCGDGRTDATGHGTAVAGVIASQTHGAAPFVQVLPVRVSLPGGRHAAFQSALGIAWAAQQDVDIINLSYTNQHRRRPSWLEQAAIRFARSRHIGVIASAGNDPSLPVGYPAAYPGVLSVGSIDPDGHMSAFSARHPRPNGLGLDVVAPGGRVVTLAPGGQFHVASGTSLAAPAVAAAAANLLLEDEQLTGRRAVERLRTHVGGAVSPADQLMPQ